MTEYPTITIAILTRGRLEKLKLCISALIPQLGESDKIIILDTGSTDGTRDYVFPGESTILLRTDSPGDFAACRNQLIANSRGDILAFTDDDCYPSPDWIFSIRNSLQTNDGVGGSCLPARLFTFPWWWTSSVAWTVGFSTATFLRGNADSYPATSNMAAYLKLFQKLPFEESFHLLDSGNPYTGGREDATWWKRQRIQGRQMVAEPKALVYHDIPADRISLRYTFRRARADGTAFWVRDGSVTAAKQIRFELAVTCANLIKSVLKRERTGAIEGLYWLQRTLGAWSAARSSEDPAVRLETSLWKTGATFKNECRRVAGRLSSRTISRVRSRTPWPPTRPARIYIAAEGYVGDTVMLRPLIQLLSENFPTTEILVAGRFHELLQGFPKNVSLLRSGASPTLKIDIAFVPYFVSGAASTWKQVARIGTTFSTEVGFTRDRYYALARRLVYKDANEHELHNLLKLFSLWPLTGNLSPPGLEANAEDVQELRRSYPHFFTSDRKVISIQLGTGQHEKSWPVARYRELVSRLAEEYPEHLFALVGDRTQAEAAEDIRSLRPDRIANFCGCSLRSLISLLSLCSYHVGGCSAPMQIAVALGVPTFTLYGPTEPERWGSLFEKEKHAYARAVPHPLTWSEVQSLAGEYLIHLLTLNRVHAGIKEHLLSRGLA